jgi:nucleoside-diphosphate-sugar epimerase
LKVLITGHLGFIGKSLWSELNDHGHEIYGYDLKQSINYDIRVMGNFSHVLKSDDYDLVIHLAAGVGKLNCEQRPMLTLETNVYGTLNVAQACAEAEIPLVYCSTSEVYGDWGTETVTESRPVHDDMLVSPLKDKVSGMYALTKRWGEEICKNYAPNGLKIIRPVMPYGIGVPPGEGRRALDNLVWQSLTGQPMIVHRGASRSWCYITDIASGIRAVIEDEFPEDGFPAIYNVGRDDDEISMEHLAIMTIDARRGVVKRPEKDEMSIDKRIVITDPPDRQTAVKRISCAKLRALGWEPTVNLDQGLPLMVEWVRQWIAEQRGK